MNNIITGVGCFVVTCMLFACPIGLTLVCVYGKAWDLIFLTMALDAATVCEFLCTVITLYQKCIDPRKH